MNFLNPFALLGLAAASIPVILHLLNLRKLKTVEFSSLRFLKELQKTRIRKLKIKQIILLILRTLIIIFAVMAFARPTVDASLPLMGQYAKMSTVILIDNSFSMDISDETGNLFNNAKTEAIDIIDNMREGDEAVVIPLAGSPSSRDVMWSRNASYLKEELSKIKISNTKANLSSGFSLAQKLFDESTNLNKQLFILSDFQPNVFFRPSYDSLKYFDSNTLIYAIRSGGEKNGLKNLSIDSLHVKTRIFRPGKAVDVSAFIKNNSKVEVKGAIVSLYFNNERVAQRTIDINPDEIKMLDISAPAETRGFVSAKVELEPDVLEADNSRYFGFIVPEKPKVALAGNPGELSFVKLALNAGEISDENIEKISFADISTPVINNFDVLIASLEGIDGTSLEILKKYLNDGGSAMIFAGENRDNDKIKEFFKDVGLGEVRTIDVPKDDPIRFQGIDKIHPLFEGVFKGTTQRNEITESPDIFRAMPVTGGQRVIEMPEGAFLSEIRFGEGKGLYCAVSPGMQWSNLPVTGFFPAMVYRGVYYLSAKEEFGERITAGNSIRLNLPKRSITEQKVRVTDPNGKDFYANTAFLPQSAIIELNSPDILGVYLIYSSKGKPLATLSVNPPSSESTITSFGEDYIMPLLSTFAADPNMIKYKERDINIAQVIKEAKTGTELWQLFLVLAIIAALSEMLIARNKKADTNKE